jgi:hypothetical protein
VIIASVGSTNTYGHPCVNYIRHARRAGIRFLCTQLTKHCERPGHLHHVFKGAAMLGLPQVSKGFSCRGTVRLSFDGSRFRYDDFAERQHAAQVKTLARPKCLKFG